MNTWKKDERKTSREKTSQAVGKEKEKGVRLRVAGQSEEIGVRLTRKRS